MAKTFVAPFRKPLSSAATPVSTRVDGASGAGVAVTFGFSEPVVAQAPCR